MMNYEEFFNKAFADIREDYSCPDNETILNDVLERARKMEKNKEKRRSILNAAAGTAAAVAVIGGSAFGLSYLNEHGGLKEGRVDGNAGYHSEIQQEETKDIMDAVGDVIEFDDMTATIEQVLYDGHLLRVIYRVDSYDEQNYNSPADNEIRLNETSDLLEEMDLLGPDGVYYRSSDGNPYNKYLDKTVRRNVTTLFRELSEGESTHLEFIRINGSDRQYFGSYTLNGIDMPENSYILNGSFTVPSETHQENDGYSEKTEIYSGELTPLGAYIMTSNTELFYKDLNFRLMFRDGSVKELFDIKLSTMQDIGDDTVYNGSGHCYMGGYTVPKEIFGLNREIEDGMALIDIISYLYDPIDVNDVSAVIINGKEIPLNFCSGEDLKDAAALIGELESKGSECHIICERNDDIPAGCVIRTEPEFGLLDELPESYELHISGGAAVQKTFDIAHRADGEPSGIPEIVNFGYTEGKTYIDISQYSFYKFIDEISADSDIAEEFTDNISIWFDESGDLKYDRLCEGLETVEVRGFLDNEPIPGIRYFRVSDKYILGARAEDARAFVLVDAETGGAGLYGVRTDYNGIRHIIELLWAVHDSFPDMTVTAAEETGNGNVTLEISVNDDERPLLEQYLSDNGADLSLCRFYKLYMF